MKNDIECGVLAFKRAYFSLSKSSHNSKFMNFELWQSCSRGAHYRKIYACTYYIFGAITYKILFTSVVLNWRGISSP